MKTISVKLYILLTILIVGVYLAGMSFTLASNLQEPPTVISSGVTGQIDVVWYDASVKMSEKIYPDVAQPNMPIGENLTVMRQGASCYLRVKCALFVNGNEVDNSYITLKNKNNNFVLGEDGYYYYVNLTTNNRTLTLASAQFCQSVVLPMSFPDSWQNSAHLSLTADAIQADAQAYADLWRGAQPPQVWLDAQTVT